MRSLLWSPLSLLATGLLASLPAISLAKSSTGDNVLVVLEPKLKRESFSKFFSSLEGRGYNLTFRSVKENKPLVSEFDVPSYNHVILFAPTTKNLPEDLSPQSIVSLLSAEPPVNFLIALSPTATQLSSLASEFSLSVPPPNTPLISHFPQRDGPHDVIPIQVAHTTKLLDVRQYLTKPIWFSGVPFAFTSDSPMIFPILNAPPESVATDTESDKSGHDTLVDAAEKGGEGLWAGASLGVVTGFQTRTGARVTWAGGVSVFSNEYVDKEIAPGRPSGNGKFLEEVQQWTFQERRIRRIASARHYLSTDRVQKKQHEHYTVNDQVSFEFELEAWDAKTGRWVQGAGLGDGITLDDVQLEFVMLDPFIRTLVKPVSGTTGRYRANFRVPDRHGVFKFVIDYRRKGFSTLSYTNTVSVVPKRHDEYQRFIPTAWPYYVGAISTSVGFVLFSIIYLGGEVDRKATGKTKSKAE